MNLGGLEIWQMMKSYVFEYLWIVPHIDVSYLIALQLRILMKVSLPIAMRTHYTMSLHMVV